jgi:hypothetical protein
VAAAVEALRLAVGAIEGVPARMRRMRFLADGAQ